MSQEPPIAWTHIKPGINLLAMHVFRQAKDDLSDPELREGALKFLRGDWPYRDNLLFWAAAADIPATSVMSMVRKERFHVDGAIKAASAPGEVHPVGAIESRFGVADESLRGEGEEEGEETWR